MNVSKERTAQSRSVRLESFPAACVMVRTPLEQSISSVVNWEFLVKHGIPLTVTAMMFALSLH